MTVPQTQTQARLDKIDDRLDAGSRRMQAIERQLQENTDLTRDVLQVMEIARSGLRVLGALGTAAGWLSRFTAAGLAIWAFVQAVKSGGPHTPGK